MEKKNVKKVRFGIRLKNTDEIIFEEYPFMLNRLRVGLEKGKWIELPDRFIRVEDILSIRYEYLTS